MTRMRRISFGLLLVCASVAAWARGRRFLVPFPSVSEPSQVRITLARGGCFGTCPSYEVTISGDGTIHYRGEAFVLVTGDHTAHIDPKTVALLLDSFRKAHFFGANNVYRYNATDLPTYRMTVVVGSRKKSVVDYWGEKAGMPREIIDLEDLIDKAANTALWIKGSDETASALTQEGWRFGAHDQDHIALYLRAIQVGNAGLKEAFLRAGAPVGTKVAHDSLWPLREDTPICAATGKGELLLVQKMSRQLESLSPEIDTECMSAAARSGSVAMLQFWTARGVRPSFPREETGDDVLPSAIQSGNPELVRGLLADYKPDLHLIVGRETLISWLFSHSHFGAAEQRQKTNAMAQLLMQYGADVNATGPGGTTALIDESFFEEDTRDLLMLGADPTAVAQNGDTALSRAKQYRCPVCVMLIEQALDKRAATVPAP
ncbi:hypothetical protein SAMN05421770_106267 [Granulicella rosea]|uniref:DUF6438 domain-containing protein n=1 Tax=Granulicella rosea TaxID=474952 RepID=A0A239LB97_9BACT|nr:DUF6438 domain-containing protein [Granulicella rosea]SNT27751.1 hypothetical protein SAMN05421770_106267 [Granulicella rosea]